MLKVYVGLHLIAEFPDDELSEALKVLNTTVKNFCKLCKIEVPKIRESCGISHVVIDGGKIVSVIYWDTWQKLKAIVDAFRNSDGKIPESKTFFTYMVHMDIRLYGNSEMPICRT